MAGGFNRCKICTKIIISQNASYCTSHCKKLDVRMYYTKLSILISTLSIIGFLIYAVVLQISLIFIGLTVSASMLLVFIPLYQFLQSTRIEQKLKTIYQRKSTIETEDGQEVQPVYLFLYISRNTEERSLYDEDFSEFI